MAGTGGQATDTGTGRLPVAAAGAAVLACAALFLAKQASWIVPAFAVAVAARYLAPARLPSAAWQWLARLLLFGVAVAATLWSPPSTLDELVDTRWSNLFGYLCAAEIVVQAWSRAPHVSALLALACGVFIAASNTYAAWWIRLLSPPFVLCLAMSFADRRARPGGWPRATRVAAALSFMLALGLGFGANAAVAAYRASLNAWGERLVQLYPRGILGVSLEPALGRGPGAYSSQERVLRMAGTRDLVYLRGLSFDTYHRGRWRPSVLDRPVKTITRNTLDLTQARGHVRVEKYAPLNDLLFVPLSAGSMGANGIISWSPEHGGPVVCTTVMKYEYAVAGRDAATLWPGPGAEARRRLLQVPEEIAPGVRRLAGEIGGSLPTPRQRIQAVALYLMTHYRYSTSVHPGDGDPVSHFLLEGKAAHCEYFAAAATILLRCLDVPTRYVVGYYAHETGEDGALTVRQRDAHAWAESWVDGVGWITVESTPASGRPDATRRDQPSQWQYAKEWLHDTLQGVRARAAAVPPRLLWLTIGLLAAVYLLLQFWRELRKRPRPPAPSIYLLPADRRLAELVARFNARLARAGRPCPPGRPWDEHLAACAAGETERAFVRAYNRLRFGGTPREDEIAALAAQLRTLEEEERV